MHDCCSIKVPKSNAKHWTKSIEGLSHRSELIWLTFERGCTWEVVHKETRYLWIWRRKILKLNFANLLRMSVAWKLFQEHYHYFLEAEIRRRKAARQKRIVEFCYQFFCKDMRFRIFRIFTFHFWNGEKRYYSTYSSTSLDIFIQPQFTPKRRRNSVTMKWWKEAFEIFV